MGSRFREMSLQAPQRSLGPSAVLILLFLAVPTCEASADDQDALFESKIRPLLIERCYKCHSAQHEQSGGLLLDSKPGWEQGGDSGPAIVPGDPEASLLIQAIRWDDPAPGVCGAGPGSGGRKRA